MGGVPNLLIQSNLDTIFENMEAVRIPDISIQKELEMDLNSESYRFATSADLFIDFKSKAKKHKYPDGSQLFVIKLDQKMHRGVAIRCSNVSLPKGARLFIIDESQKNYLGAYSSSHVSKNRRFITDYLPSKSLYVELYLPAGSMDDFNLIIDKAYVVYREDDIEYVSMETGFGTSYICHINSICPPSLDYGDTQNAVVRIATVFEEGAGWCTGSLLNNTAQDQRPFMLTAYHCQDGFTPLYDMWRFDFKFAFDTCEDQADNPGFCFMTGCYLRAGWQDSDFLLIELDNFVPPAANAVMNGWNNSNSYTPDSVILFSHPSGDVKSLAIDEDPIIIHPNTIHWNNGVNTPPNHHYKTVLDVGGQQPGWRAFT